MPNKRSTINKQLSTELLSNEIKFLIACCQTNPDEDLASALNEEKKCPWGEIADTPVGKTKEGYDINFIHTYLSSITNYQSLITAATQHGILPLVYKTIKNLQPNSSSIQNSKFNIQHFLLELKSHYMSIVQRNMLMTSELIKIMKLLKKNHIESLAFKGPSLSQMAYGDITLRQYVDLDVLVKKEDIYKIDALLKERGYQRVIKLTADQERLWLIFKHDMGLYHPKSAVHFEMHWSLLDEDYPIQMDTSALWNNPRTVQINGKEIKTFPIEELLLYLCIHGSTHLWERIEWIKDIDLLLPTEDIDWEKSIKIAETSNVETIFYLGIYLAHTLFATNLPSVICERIAHNKKLAALSIYIIQSWEKPKNAFPRTLAMLKLFPDTKARLSYLHKILFKPTLNEYDFVNLPKRMYWAYYFVRPYLLIKKHVSKN